MIVLDKPSGNQVNYFARLPLNAVEDPRIVQGSCDRIPSTNVNHRRELASDAPPMLTPLASCVAEIRDEWFVAETQTNYERSIAWKMIGAGFPYYLPLVERVKMIGGVKRRKIVPLFANYLFAAGEDAMQFCRESPRVLNILKVGIQKQIVRELSSLEIALFANPRLEVCDVDTIGQRVRVTGGRMEGVEGEVTEFHESCGMVRVVIKIEMLGKGTPFEIDRSYLEPI